MKKLMFASLMLLVAVQFIRVNSMHVAPNDRPPEKSLETTFEQYEIHGSDGKLYIVQGKRVASKEELNGILDTLVGMRQKRASEEKISYKHFTISKGMDALQSGR